MASPKKTLTPQVEAFLRDATGLPAKSDVRVVCPTTLMIAERARITTETARLDHHADCCRFWRVASRASDKRIGKLVAERMIERIIGQPVAPADIAIMESWPPHELRALAGQLYALYDSVAHAKRGLLWAEMMFTPQRRAASKPRILEVRLVTTPNQFGQLGCIADVRWHANWSKTAYTQ